MRRQQRGECQRRGEGARGAEEGLWNRGGGRDCDRPERPEGKGTGPAKLTLVSEKKLEIWQQRGSSSNCQICMRPALIASLKGLETEMDRAGCLSYNSY